MMAWRTVETFTSRSPPLTKSFSSSLGRQEPWERGPWWAPFSRPIIEAIIRHVVADGSITPRKLMKAFDSLLSEVDYRLSTGEPVQLEPKSAVSMVENMMAELESETDED